MNNLLGGLLLAGALAMASLPAVAEVDENTARTVMQETGMWDALSAMPAGLRQGMQSGAQATGGMIPADVVERLLKASEVSFTAERAQATALGVMSKGLDASTVIAVRSWNSSALGQKLAAQTKAGASSSTDPARRLADGQAALKQADDARRQALNDIIDATRAVEQTSEIALVTAVAVVRGMAAASPAAAGMLPPEDQLRTLIKGQMAGALQQMQTSLAANLAAIHAGASTGELQQYVAYLRSPAGTKFNELNFASVTAALKDGTEEFGRKVAAGAMPPGGG